MPPDPFPPGLATKRTLATPLLDELAIYDRRPSLLAERLHHCMPLRDYGPRGQSEAAFRHRSRTGTIGDLHITIGHTSPFGASIGEQPEFATVNLCLAGSGAVRLGGGKPLPLDRSHPLVFTPGMAHRCDMDQYLGVVIRVPQQRLRRSAQAMAGSRPRDPGLPLELLKPQGIDALTPRSQILLRNLCSSLDMLASSSGITSHEWAWLGLDDHIVRLLLLLLNPALQKDSPTSEYHLDGAATKRRLDPLLDWIQAHLKCPLSLSELEARSGYSRRSLQLLFRHHLGCTPSQWVRHRRLEAVHGRLLHPEETDTVGSVALEYGFSSASSFTREFHKCFGQLPSELLRQSRGRL